MRALLVVNPRATTTSPRAREVIVHAVRGTVDVDVVDTTARGHARQLAEQARRDGLDAVLVLGGDGTVNEVVNGLLAEGPGHDVPLLGTIPGGSANVFARSIGMPEDPVEATGEVIEALEHKRARTIGLGEASWDGRSRWFLCNAGLGVDAEIIHDMERQRAGGHEATPTRYFQTAVAHVVGQVGSGEGPLTVSRPGVSDVPGVHLAIVQNASPWTFLGALPVDPCPHAGFDTGLDLFGLRSFALHRTLGQVRRILAPRRGRRATSGSLNLHDQSVITVTADRPTALQVDGDAEGMAASVTFRARPRAISVLV